jgi:hypothetical protein
MLYNALFSYNACSENKILIEKKRIYIYSQYPWRSFRKSHGPIHVEATSAHAIMKDKF